MAEAVAILANESAPEGELLSALEALRVLVEPLDLANGG